MARECRSSMWLGVLAALALSLGGRAQGSPIGNEFQVNIFVPYFQGAPSVAVSASGDFVVAWQTYSQSSSGYDVSARRFSSTGDPLASEFQVNTYTGDQRAPSVAIDGDGDFVVVWHSTGQDGSYEGVFARLFSSAGSPLAGELQVNSYTTNVQRFPSVAASASGDFVVAWNSFQDGSGYGVFARRFSSTGAPLAIEFQVNTYTTDYQQLPSVAASASGDFVVAWQSFEQDGSRFGVFAQRFASAGARLASEFQVNTYTSLYQHYPSVAADADGDFVVAWETYDQDGSAYGVSARRFSSAGAPLADEFQVNSYTPGSEGVPSVAAASGGGLVVAWQSFGQDGSGIGIFAARFSSTGAPMTGEFQVNTYTTDSQRFPSVAASASGDFVVAWQSFGQDTMGQFDTPSEGVFAQRFAALATLDIDGNGATLPLTDGLLVLRHLFGFNGLTLITGATAGDCTRCDAAAIEPYLGGLGMILDIDGNTMTDPLTDGLLALRFLFGFTGDTLITGAVGGGCSRCDAPSIQAYLAGLTA